MMLVFASVEGKSIDRGVLSHGFARIAKEPVCTMSGSTV